MPQSDARPPLGAEPFPAAPRALHLAGIHAAGVHLPLLDRPAVEELASQMGDRDAVARFLRSFVELLPDRIAEIGASGEPKHLADQGESIAAAAAMAGAPLLAYLVAQIVTSARAGHLPVAGAVQVLRATADATGVEMDDLLRDLEAAC